MRSNLFQRLFGPQRQFNRVGVVDVGFVQVDANEPAAALLHALAEVAHGGNGAARADLHHQRRHLGAIQPSIEQRRRLQERLDDPTKHWKFDHNDIAVRQRWPDYQRAYDQLLSATHTPWAPWTVVPADSKAQRNLMIATLLREVLRNLDLRYPSGDPALEHFTVE